MPAPPRWTARTLALGAGLALAAPAPAQIVGPGPKLGPGPKKADPVVVMPSVNTLPGVPAYQLFRPVFDPAFLPNPALNNPWMNQTTVTPVRVNPFPVSPLPPLFNPFGPGFNPLPGAHGILPGGCVGPGCFPTPRLPTFPTVTSTPPLAVRQPGLMMYKGPDLQVNPTSGTVYRPQSGTATLADGTTYYRVAGSGLPTATGAYATGTGLYYDPKGGTFFNPGSGVISKPGRTNVFLPYIW